MADLLLLAAVIENFAAPPRCACVVDSEAGISVDEINCWKCTIANHPVGAVAAADTAIKPACEALAFVASQAACGVTSVVAGIVASI